MSELRSRCYTGMDGSGGFKQRVVYVPRAQTEKSGGAKVLGQA